MTTTTLHPSVPASQPACQAVWLSRDALAVVNSPLRRLALIVFATASFFAATPDVHAEEFVTIVNQSTRSVYYAHAYYEPEVENDDLNFIISERWVSQGWYEVPSGQQRSVNAAFYILVQQDGKKVDFPDVVGDGAHFYSHPSDAFMVSHEHHGDPNSFTPDAFEVNKRGWTNSDGFQHYQPNSVLAVQDIKKAELFISNVTNNPIQYVLNWGNESESYTLMPGAKWHHWKEGRQVSGCFVRFDHSFGQGYQEKVFALYPFTSTNGITDEISPVERPHYFFQVVGDGLGLNRAANQDP